MKYKLRCAAPKCHNESLVDLLKVADEHLFAATCPTCSAMFWISEGPARNGESHFGLVGFLPEQIVHKLQQQQAQQPHT